MDPASGATLRTPVRRRTITVRALDVESGVWREEEKQLLPVTGYDLVFSCPKSVSLLHALNDESVRREMSEAHESAWQSALVYLEREAVRRTYGGVVARFANEQRLRTCGCICVSACRRFRGAATC